jgi:hypothetical protein
VVVTEEAEFALINREGFQRVQERIYKKFVAKEVNFM